MDLTGLKSRCWQGHIPFWSLKGRLYLLAFSSCQRPLTHFVSSPILPSKPGRCDDVVMSKPGGRVPLILPSLCFSLVCLLFPLIGTLMIPLGPARQPRIISNPKVNRLATLTPFATPQPHNPVHPQVLGTRTLIPLENHYSAYHQSHFSLPLSPTETFKKHFFVIGLELFYNVGLVSTVQQSKSVIFIHGIPFFVFTSHLGHHRAQGRSSLHFNHKEFETWSHCSEEPGFQE